MTSRETSIETKSADRYLADLCRVLGERAGSPAGKGATVESSDREGLVDLGWGRCRLSADESSLSLRFEAESEEDLVAIQELITRHLEHLDREAGELLASAGEDEGSDKDQRRDWMRHFHRRMHDGGAAH